MSYPEEQVPWWEGTIIEAITSQFMPLPYPTSDFSGQTYVVTGANTGLGLEAARHFVRLNAAKVIIGCRNVDKGNLAKADIESSTNRKGVVEVWQVDLSSFDSVKEFCSRVDKLDRIDAVVENAGVATRQFSEAEGYEQQITVNVISTFLMAVLLLPTLRRTATKFNVTPRLVIVSSDAHRQTSFPARKEPSIFETLKGPNNMASRYSDSKLLEILVVRELAKEMDLSKKPSVILNCLNPALCRSELFRYAQWPLSWIMPIVLFLIARTSEMGSRVLVTAATAGEETHGKYNSDCRVHSTSKFVRSEQGVKVGKRVYDELMGILDTIQPGIRNKI